MNLKKNNIQNPEVKSPSAKKPHQKLKPLCFISSMAIGLSLISCVAPAYDTVGDTGTTYHSTGYEISSLPSGYRTERISGTDYYYNDGYYYQPSSSGYTVVSAPSTSRYYDDYSRARQSRTSSRTRRDGAYNRGAQPYSSTQVITRLPSGYREVNHRGNTYYRAGDSYYQQKPNGYVIVQSPF